MNQHRKQYWNCRTERTYQFTIADERTGEASVVTIGPEIQDGKFRSNRFNVEIDLAPNATLSVSVVDQNT